MRKCKIIIFSLCLSSYISCHATGAAIPDLRVLIGDLSQFVCGVTVQGGESGLESCDVKLESVNQLILIVLCQRYVLDCKAFKPLAVELKIL